ncbi:MAG: hypothetical protein JOZ15_12430, partial [Acidobacteria bacterium]|nr:hypothetical protein [Acidobacteriota bacterium]
MRTPRLPRLSRRTSLTDPPATLPARMPAWQRLRRAAPAAALLSLGLLAGGCGAFVNQ